MIARCRELRSRWSRTTWIGKQIGLPWEKTNDKCVRCVKFRNRMANAPKQTSLLADWSAVSEFGGAIGHPMKLEGEAGKS